MLLFFAALTLAQQGLIVYNSWLTFLSGSYSLHLVNAPAHTISKAIAKRSPSALKPTICYNWEYNHPTAQEPHPKPPNCQQDRPCTSSRSPKEGNHPRPSFTPKRTNTAVQQLAEFRVNLKGNPFCGRMVNRRPRPLRHLWTQDGCCRKADSIAELAVPPGGNSVPPQLL